MLSVHVSATSTVPLPYAELVQIQTLANCGPLSFIIWTAELDKIIVIANHRIGVSQSSLEFSAKYHGAFEDRF